jgi:hypothetical protein
MTRTITALGLALFLSVPLRAAEPQEIFVAVGYGGRRISSTDGMTWQNDQRWSDEAKDDDNVLFNISYGLGRFIAVGGGASIGHLLSSSDGKTWIELPRVKGRVATIAFGNGRFVAGHDAELLYSTDGTTFEKGAKFEVKGSLHARRSAFGSGEAGPRFVIIGDADLSETKTRVAWRGSTEDGARVTSMDVDTPPARDIAYGSGHFVVVGPKGLIESSHDGQSWKRHEAPEENDFSRVVWTGSRFLVGGGKSAWTSPDGLTWSPESGSIPGTIALAGDLPKPFGIAFSWGGNIHVSDDLQTWRKVAVPPGPSLEAVARSGR